MKSLDQVAEKVRRGESLPFYWAALLSAATPIVRVGMWGRRRRRRVRVSAHVVSIGNITVGGTGKTPAVIERARAEIELGRKVAVLTRGYGSERGRRLAVIAAGDALPEKGDWLGDEPLLIARSAPGVMIVKGADRVAAARKAIEEFGSDVLILDDGFQYVRLERDENILVIDATNPFGNGRLLPRGVLREPLQAMRRATQILLTRCDQAENLGQLLDSLRCLCPQLPIRTTRHAPRTLWRIADGVTLPLEMLRGAVVTAVCAVGNPEAFFKTLEELGACLERRLAFRNHSRIPRECLPDSGLVVTTEKDAMRLSGVGSHVLALRIEIEDWNRSTV